jgi:hypothetical protein
MKTFIICLVVVIVIIIVVLSFCAISSKPEPYHPLERVVRQQLKLFEIAMFMYYENLGTFPEKLDYLWVCPPGMSVDKWQGPYVEGTEILNFDVWDRPYQVELFDVGQTCRITSAGSDGKFGTDDDIYIEYSVP